MQSKAATVPGYIAELPEDRRVIIEAVRKTILKNLDKDYKEGMQYGMIGYSIPHSIFPAGYHCDPRQPLPFAGLASQKQYVSLYLMGVYCGCVDGKDTPEAKWFKEAWVKAGKKLDMGRACIRFKKLEEVPLDVVGEAIRRMPVKKYIDYYTGALASMGKGLDGKPLKTGKPTPKPAPKSPRMKSAAKPAKKTTARKG